MSKHDTTPRLSTITRGHNLIGVTPIAKADQRSQASHLQPNQEPCPHASHLLHAANDCEHDCHDSLHAAEVA
jgi:hypothetical protein